MRREPLAAPTPQTLAPWPEVLACLRQLAALAAAGTAFQLVELPGQVACVVADAPAPPAKAVTVPRARRAAAKG